MWFISSWWVQLCSEPLNTLDYSFWMLFYSPMLQPYQVCIRQTANKTKGKVHTASKLVMSCWHHGQTNQEKRFRWTLSSPKYHEGVQWLQLKTHLSRHFAASQLFCITSVNDACLKNASLNGAEATSFSQLDLYDLLWPWMLQFVKNEDLMTSVFDQKGLWFECKVSESALLQHTHTHASTHTHTCTETVVPFKLMPESYKCLKFICGLSATGRSVPPMGPIKPDYNCVLC